VRQLPTRPLHGERHLPYTPSTENCSGQPCRASAAMASSGPTGFLGRSSSSNSNMRGLVQFIADLRNARARELEEKRINKELANIRQKFKGLPHLLGLWRAEASETDWRL